MLARSMRTQADLRRSAFQFKRKAFGENPPVDGRVLATPEIGTPSYLLFLKKRWRR